jgi:hypothetical protein
MVHVNFSLRNEPIKLKSAVSSFTSARCNFSHVVFQRHTRRTDRDASGKCIVQISTVHRHSTSQASSGIIQRGLHGECQLQAAKRAF